MKNPQLLILSLFILFHFKINAQDIQPITGNKNRFPSSSHGFQRCFTAEYYDSLFRKVPGFKAMFQANQKRLASKKLNSLKVSGTNDTIAVVIHVIVNSINQAKISDADLQSQIDVLNEDYAGLNADTSRIPASFKPLFGKMGLTFRLAQTNPDGDPTNGIERRSNTLTFDGFTIDNAKLFSMGGMDAWDPTNYLNIWVIDFGTSGILGSSIFPGDPRDPTLHGVVFDYRAFGRTGSYLVPEYNTGKTASHEIGHFFNLYHIWGDDDGACTETDFPDDPPANDDTPNQGNFTQGNPDPHGLGIVLTDNCSPATPGIMYQNYMDYTDDSDLVMFTKGQVNRMNTALSSPDRAPLLNSIAFRPPFLYTYDAKLKSIINPAYNSSKCNTDFNPKIKIRNQGSALLTSITVNVNLNGIVTSIPYSLNLSHDVDTTLSLPSITAVPGTNQLKIYTSLPDGNADENVSNDTLKTQFKILSVVALNDSIKESFSTSAFPPANWDIRNPDNDMTWQWNPSYGANQAGSAWFNDFNNPTNFKHDDLVMPLFSYQNKDSIFLKFNFASAVYSDPNTTNTPIDTLTLLISKDCGNSFTTIYKKWGNDMNTTGHDGPYTTEFFPNLLQWRADSVNIGNWLSTSESSFQVSFRFSGNYENNFFLDDVSIITKTLPVKLKEQGYLITPNPFQNQFSVWFYHQPIDLKYINVFNAAGQLMWTQSYSGNANTYISINLAGQAPGIYYTTLGFTDSKKNITRKLVKTP